MKTGTMAARQAADRTQAALAIAQQVDARCHGDYQEAQCLLDEVVQILRTTYPNLSQPSSPAQST